jgi:hypothetical protein
MIGNGGPRGDVKIPIKPALYEGFKRPNNFVAFPHINNPATHSHGFFAIPVTGLPISVCQKADCPRNCLFRFTLVIVWPANKR